MSRFGPKLAGANEQTTGAVMGRLRAAQAPDGLRLGEDFPLVCETCLGEDRLVRMMKLKAPAACKLTGRPFTVFRWRRADTREFKETQICYEIAAEKNVCQCCMHDLELNIPLALRESMEAAMSSSSSSAGAHLQVAQNQIKNLGGNQQQPGQMQAQHQRLLEQQHRGTGGVPVSEVNQAFYYNQQLADQSRRGGWSQTAPGFKLRPMANQTTSEAGVPIDLPPICTSWARGRCGRSGRLACRSRPCCGAFIFPELHASPIAPRVWDLEKKLREKGPIKIVPTDPQVQAALLAVAQADFDRRHERALRPPSDASITTLFLAGIPKDATTQSLRKALESLGKVRQLKHAPGKTSALVEFTNRNDAETAVQHLQGRLFLSNSTKAIRVGWAVKRKSNNRETDSARGGDKDSKADVGSPDVKKRRKDSEVFSTANSDNGAELNVPGLPSSSSSSAAVAPVVAIAKPTTPATAAEAVAAAASKFKSATAEPMEGVSKVTNAAEITNPEDDTIKEGTAEEEDDSEDHDEEDDDDDDDDDDDEKRHPRVPLQGTQGLVQAPLPLPQIAPGIILPAGMKVGDKLPDMPPALLELFKKDISPNFQPRQLPTVQTNAASPSQQNPQSAPKFEQIYPSLQGYALEGSIAIF
eukprot:CAMPEP_0171544228 /NCGR_PEP_ID=MMETSP0960-20121227/3384_1 /TAXON_ID=87120 /ORGANISM="Aurantiochytrium limacinum, Strain ATCCMYA-1381" /LENGTH=640 /DNA_ID=CAMNT_0012092013 /DNA_START=15 /DNA_END=1937 /DNA_ORIENTATION=-